MASSKVRFSLFSLIVLIAVVAIAAAALLQPIKSWASALFTFAIAAAALLQPIKSWASALFTFAIAALCWATAKALLPGRWRSFAVGFSIFGWVHFALLFGLLGQGTTTFPCPRPPTLFDMALEAAEIATRPPGPSVNFSAMTMVGPDGKVLYDSIPTQQVGRSLGILLAGFAGGWLTFLATRPKQNTEAPTA